MAVFHLFIVYCSFDVAFGGRSKSVVHLVWWLALGILSSWLGLHAVTHFVRAVIVDESGLVVQRVVPSRRIRWSDVTAVELRCERKSDKRRRMFMRLGALVGLRLRDEQEELEGDPFVLRQLRPRCLVSATVFGADGACVAFFPGYVGWEFADALYAEVERRGVRFARRQGATDHAV